MKAIIKSTVAVLTLGLLATGVFATEKPKTEAPANNKKDVILFTALPQQDFGVGVIINKAAPGKSSVAIYDEAGKQIYKDDMSKGGNVLKGYQLSNLDNGNYSIKVATGNNLVTRNIHVYTDENDQKNFFFVL
jgi:hypothetical protein